MLKAAVVFARFLNLAHGQFYFRLRGTESSNQSFAIFLVVWYSVKFEGYNTLLSGVESRSWQNLISEFGGGAFCSKRVGAPWSFVLFLPTLRRGTKTQKSGLSSDFQFRLPNFVAIQGPPTSESPPKGDTGPDFHSPSKEEGSCF